MFDPKLDMTVVVGIDAKTIQQFAISHQTWWRYRPEMWLMPWVVFYDREQLEYWPTKKWLIEQAGLPESGLELVPWPPPNYAVPYSSQREKMLAGHVYVPAGWVSTAWYLKIDTDCIASRVADWMPADWFGGESVVVAPRWHYTKGVGFLDRLENWGDKVPELAQYPRMNIPHKPGQLRVGHSRFCSWLSFYRASFARQVAVQCRRACGEYRLPVPSQDTTHWYSAARMGLAMRIENMKARGWSNHSRLEELARVASEVMQRPTEIPLETLPAHRDAIIK